MIHKTQKFGLIVVFAVLKRGMGFVEKLEHSAGGAGGGDKLHGPALFLGRGKQIEVVPGVLFVDDHDAVAFGAWSHQA